MLRVIFKCPNEQSVCVYNIVIELNLPTPPPPLLVTGERILMNLIRGR